MNTNKSVKGIRIYDACGLCGKGDEQRGGSVALCENNNHNNNLTVNILCAIRKRP